MKFRNSLSETGCLSRVYSVIFFQVSRLQRWVGSFKTTREHFKVVGNNSWKIINRSGGYQSRSHSVDVQRTVFARFSKI